MTINRSSVVRFSSSALLAVVFTLGAHTFVPAAYGCSQPGGSDCKTSTGKADTSSTVGAPAESDSFLSQLTVVYNILGLLIP